MNTGFKIKNKIEEIKKVSGRGLKDETGDGTIAKQTDRMA